jgi:4-hydroxythreonine-4-phosphate dehydrogenase
VSQDTDVSVTHRLALTAGEPAGIGPDLAVLLAQSARDVDVVVIADPELLKERAARLGKTLRIRPFDPAADRRGDMAGELCVAAVPMAVPTRCGQLDARNANYVLQTLDYASDGCRDGRFDAMVTGPIHKGIINEAGIPFTGHTEYLAARTGSDPVMLLVADSLRVALATTHLPLADVPAALTRPVIETVLHILHTGLRHRFAIKQPRILVCGLNPHAGEGGHLGREEIEVITPTLDALRATGMDLQGPLPADTLFTPQYLQHADAVLAMYHDQGLPVLKYAGFGHAVNVTLGLPIIRTSVDHGTALDKAGSGNIDKGSLLAALKLAGQLA